MVSFDEQRVADCVHRVAEQVDFSGVVSVVAGDRRVDRAFGLAERSYGVANTVSTRFGVASGGKLLTALGIGVLIDRGACELDTRLVDVLTASLPNLSNQVTLEHLLTHTSGVYDYYDEELVDDFDDFELPIHPSRLSTVDAYLPMLTAGKAKFPPGERFSYSNGGYVLLGLAIEALGGQSFQQFVRTHVLRPCGMEDSGFFRFDQLPHRVATGYVDVGDGWRTNVFHLPIMGGPDGGLFATAEDILRLWRALLGHELLSADLSERFLAPTIQASEHTFYGRGIWVHPQPSGVARLHVEGCDAGVSFKSSCYDRTLVATVMSNTTEGAWPMADALETLIRPRRT